MVVVGADVHKRPHTFVAVNEAGRKLAEKTVTAITAGHAEAVMWAREQFGADVLWPIEDCRHLSARLERDCSPCLKRRLARVVFNHLHTDHNYRQKPCQTAAA